MAYLTAGQVNSWLATTKYTVTEVNADLERAASELVVGRVGSRYVTTDWVDAETTPAVVVDILAMLVAAWEYDKAIAEEDGEGNNYGTRLEKRAMALLGDIVDGSIDLSDETETVEPTSPAFYPTDNSTASEESPSVFSMAQVW